MYQRINWEDKPSQKTPINAENLNKMDIALDGADVKVSTESTINDTVSGGLKINEIRGKSIQNGTPTPEKEVKIENPSFSEVRSTNKNILGGEYFADLLVSSGATATKDESNKTVSLQANSNTQKFKYNKFKPNTQYTIFVKGYNTNGLDNPMNMAINYSNGERVALFFDKDKSKIKQYITNGNDFYIEGNWNDGNAIYNYEDFGIFEGSISLEEFEEYKGSKATIPLTTLADGDKIVEKDGVWGTYKTKGSVTFDGSENWEFLLFNRHNCFYCSLGTNLFKNYASNSNSKSNRFIYSDQLKGGNYTYYISPNDAFNFANDDIKNVEEWKNWLKTHPIHCIAELKEPTFVPFEPLVQKQLNSLKTYDNQTNILTNSELQPIIESEYGKSKLVAYTLEALNNSKNCLIKEV